MKKIFSFYIIFTILISLFFVPDSLISGEEKNKEIKDNVVTVFHEENIIATGIIFYQKDLVYVLAPLIEESKNIEILTTNFKRKEAKIVNSNDEKELSLISFESNYNYLEKTFISGNNISKIGQYVNVLYSFDDSSKIINFASGILSQKNILSKNGFFYDSISSKQNMIIPGGIVVDSKQNFIGMISSKKAYSEEVKTSSFYYMLDYRSVIFEGLVLLEKAQKSVIPYSLRNLETFNLSKRDYYQINKKQHNGIVIMDFSIFNFFLRKPNLGEIIIEINNIKITNKSELEKILTGFSPGDEILLTTLNRRGNKQSYNVELKGGE